jgi:hypothetical protein
MKPKSGSTLPKSSKLFPKKRRKILPSEEMVLPFFLEFTLSCGNSYINSFGAQNLFHIDFARGFLINKKLTFIGVDLKTKIYYSLLE